MKILLTTIVCVSVFYLKGQQEDPVIRFAGLKIFSHDLERAKSFYSEKLGFEISSTDKNQLVLNTNTWPIYIEKAESSNQTNYPKEARTGLALLTSRLLPRIDDLRSKEIAVFDSLLSRNGVGIAIPFSDPSGNVINTIEVQIRDIEPFKGLQIYNCGVTISNMDNAIGFYENALGFEEWSRNYLPDALPLKHSDGSFAFMIHYEKGLKRNSSGYASDSQMVLMMETANLESIKSRLEELNIKYQEKKEKIVCQDPEGNYIEISQS